MSDVLFGMNKNRFFACIVLLVGCGFLLGSAVVEQGEPEAEVGTALDVMSIPDIEVIVVTGQREAPVLAIPASVTVLKRDEIEAMGAKHLGDVLKWVPGAFDSSTASSNLTIRGVGSAMAGGALVLVDGMPKKFGTGRFPEYQFIPASRIERIEVLRSPGIAYGPGSARGVINVVTQRDAVPKALQLNLSGSYGSWNSADTSAALHGELGGWDYSCDFSYSRSDGYEDEARSSVAGALKTGYRYAPQGRIDINASLTEHQEQIAYGFGKHAYQLEGFRRRKHFPAKKGDSTLVWHNSKDQLLHSVALDLRHVGAGWFVDASASRAGFSELYDSSAQRETRPSRVYREHRDQGSYLTQIKGGFDFTLDPVRVEQSAGVRFESLSFQTRREYPNAPDADTNRYALDLREHQLGMFWDNQVALDSWHVNLGARLDGVFLQQENPAAHLFGKTFWLFGWKVAPSYRFSNNANAYVSVSRTYWVPPPRYIAWSVQYDSPQNRLADINPEQSTVFELGYKHRVSRALVVALGAYHTLYDGKFIGVYEDDDFVGMKNGGQATYTGLEVELGGRLLSWLGYRLVGDLLHAQWQEGQQMIKDHPSNVDTLLDLSGENVFGVPPWSFVAGLDFFPLEELHLGADLCATGPIFVDYANRLRRAETLTVDARLGYRTEQLRVWLLGKNLFDTPLERVANSTGALTEPGGVPKNRYYVLDGRYVEIGAALQW